MLSFFSRISSVCSGGASATLGATNQDKSKKLARSSTCSTDRIESPLSLPLSHSVNGHSQIRIIIIIKTKQVSRVLGLGSLGSQVLGLFGLRSCLSRAAMSKYMYIYFVIIYIYGTTPSHHVCALSAATTRLGVNKIMTLELVRLIAHLPLPLSLSVSLLAEDPLT